MVSGSDGQQLVYVFDSLKVKKRDICQNVFVHLGCLAGRWPSASFGYRPAYMMIIDDTPVVYSFVRQEKGRLVTDLKRLKQHFKAYGPTLKELERKYQVSTRTVSIKEAGHFRGGSTAYFDVFLHTERCSDQ